MQKAEARRRRLRPTTLRACQLYFYIYVFLFYYAVAAAVFSLRPTVFTFKLLFPLSAFLRESTSSPLLSSSLFALYISLPLLMLNDSFILDSLAFIFLNFTVFFFFFFFFFLIVYFLLQD